MTLTDHWNEIFTTGGTTRVFTVPRAVPAGQLLALAIGRGNAGLVTAITSVRGNPWVIELSGTHSNTTFSCTLATMRVTTALQAGDTFTVTASATSNRWTLAAGVFDDVIFPVNRVVASLLSTAQPEPNAGPTPDLVVPRALVLTAVAMTGTGAPITNKVNAIADQVVTTAGSADRGCALLYKNEGGYPHTGSYKVTASASSVGITAAYECNDLPPGTIPYMTDQGEVPGILSYWDGSVEHPVTSLEFAPAPPAAPLKMIGMSSPTSLWDTRLAEVGAANITCRRIFADMTSDGMDQNTLIEQAIGDGMLPVVSYKEPKPGGIPDVDGVIDGTYDSWISNIQDYLVSLDTEIITIFHHEARNDMTQTQFLAASRHWLDNMQTSNIKVAPVNMGFLLDTTNGRNEFNTWSNAGLLADWDYFGIDSYHSGSFDFPGPHIPGDRIAPLVTWLSTNGHPDKEIIICEYNGWSPESIADSGEVFLSTPNVKLAMIFNSDSGGKGEPLSGDRLTAFQDTKNDPRVLTTYVP